jgi:hypothetical protein
VCLSDALSNVLKIMTKPHRIMNVLGTQCRVSVSGLMQEF